MSREWISLAAAGRKIGTTGRAVRRLAERGEVSLLRLPGCHPRVRSLEVDRLAEEHIQQAARLRIPAAADQRPERLTEPVVA